MTKTSKKPEETVQQTKNAYSARIFDMNMGYLGEVRLDGSPTPDDEDRERVFTRFLSYVQSLSRGGGFVVMNPDVSIFNVNEADESDAIEVDEFNTAKLAAVRPELIGFISLEDAEPDIPTEVDGVDTP
jgi:hypothetical protein